MGNSFEGGVKLDTGMIPDGALDFKFRRGDKEKEGISFGFIYRHSWHSYNINFIFFKYYNRKKHENNKKQNDVIIEILKKIEKKNEYKHQHKRALVLTARKLVRLVDAPLRKNQIYTPKRSVINEV